MCGLVLLLSFYFKRISKLNKLDAVWIYHWKVFQTDPGEFCFKSNVLGSDQAYLQVRFPLEATEMELKSRRIPYIYWYWFISAVCCIDLNVYSDVVIYNFCIKYFWLLYFVHSAVRLWSSYSSILIFLSSFPHLLISFS